jgi:phosphoglycolate phosphatase
MTTVRALVFDFDGTLADSIGSIWLEYQRTIAEMGLPEVSHREFTRQIGRPWNDILRSFWPGIDPEEFSRHYRFQAENICPFPGVPPAVRELSGDYTLAIMTSRGEKSFKPGLKRSGLDAGMFKAIFCRDGLAYNKPDPRALAPVFEALCMKPAETVYIGDSVIDAQCALAAGAGFVAVLSGGAYGDDFRELGVKRIIPSVAQLPSALKGAGQ